ncbi:asparaginyl-tRNA synthetase [Puccinia graminis f. sp. tritici]|uniref:asparagine--tRNA ligase n=1 Tax=Puccinia graminis f. sp. tritici TaxID=56615 RepID=A0A5B0R6K8_PUCGR|nr:asparaginyl-tRNA synthetase [Puccinia graminis f. sp. tritici]KAA1120625.1 asparaginyl-tRNA synthetase [Puccinia graminis f. sp. tritici]
MLAYSARRVGAKPNLHTVACALKPLVTRRISTGITPSIVTEDLINAKEKKELSFVEIANHIGRSESWTAGLFYGKNQPTSTDLQKLTELLNLPPTEDQSNPPTSSISPDSSSSLFPVIEEILRLPTCENRLVTACGWIKTIRKQKNVSFVELIDGSTPHHLQVVVGPKDSEELETGCAIRVTGNLVLSRGNGQSKELKARSVNLIGPCLALEYPLQKKTHGAAFLRRIPHLRVRTHETSALMRIRSTMIQEASSFLHAQHFFRSETPIITFNDCEGAGEVFSVRPDSQSKSSLQPPNTISEKVPNSASESAASHESRFFGREAFLTVSGQLHLEALSASLGRVYSFGPAFRAERSQTNRHLAEFWMLEAEMSFIEDLESLMNLLENLIKSIIQNLHQSDSLSSLDLQSLGAPKEPCDSTSKSWPRITYTEAVELVQSHHEKHPSEANRLPPITWGQPLASEHEKWLSGTYAQGPIFVTDYPASIKPFYMRQTAKPSDSSQKRKTVACFDLLVPGVGELVGGSLRESNLTKLQENMMQKGMITGGEAVDDSLSNAHEGQDHKFRWYLELRKFGNPRTGGFGIGWERLLSWITGVENVRECIAFPRVTGSGHC